MAQFLRSSLPEPPISPPDYPYRDNQIREVLEIALEKMAALEEALDELKYYDKENYTNNFKSLDQVRRCNRIEALRWLGEDLKAWQEEG
jgi:hypothetical protein